MKFVGLAISAGTANMALLGSTSTEKNVFDSSLLLSVSSSLSIKNILELKVDLVAKRQFRLKRNPVKTKTNKTSTVFPLTIVISNLLQSN